MELRDVETKAAGMPDRERVSPVAFISVVSSTEEIVPKVPVPVKVFPP